MLEETIPPKSHLVHDGGRKRMEFSNAHVLRASTVAAAVKRKRADGTSLRKIVHVTHAQRVSLGKILIYTRNVLILIGGSGGSGRQIVVTRRRDVGQRNPA